MISLRVEGVSAVIEAGVKKGRMGAVSVVSTVDMVLERRKSLTEVCCVHPGT